MILQVFCVRDRATDQFGTPMFMVSAGQCIRSFSDELNRDDRENQMFRHPDDFDLYHLGSWNSSSGVFDLKSRPEQVAIGKDLKIRQAVN